MSIVSFVRGNFKTWGGGLGGKERAKWECFRQCLEELDLQVRNGTGFLAALVKDVWAGPGSGYGRAG